MPATYVDIQVAGGDTGQPLAMAKRLSVIERHLEPEARKFLDCGCGAGDYVLALASRLGLDCQGVEFDADKVRQAQADPRLGSRVRRGDLENLTFATATWDYALLNEVLEHVPNDRQALAEVFRVLRPGGTLFIFSPNRWFPFETHGVHLKGSGRAVPHWLPFVPYVPLALGKRVFRYWARNYWQNELVALARQAGFDIVERTYVWLTFEGISRNQPTAIRLARPILRAVANTLERLPLARRFGVSQVLVCRKPGQAARAQSQVA